MDLDQAIAIACRVHAGQKDLAGEPYILHPLRVMLRLRERERDVEVQIAGVLHDVIEDSKYPYHQRDELWHRRAGPALIEALEVLTRYKHEPYENYIERVSKNRIASFVKLADLEDNLNEQRLRDLDRGTAARLLLKYQPARNKLLAPVAMWW